MEVQRVEQQRLELEQNVAKLEKSLRHWQLWEAEYEGLREEVDALPADASQDDLVAISKTFGGDLVNEAEVLDVFGIKKTARSPKQASGLLSRRIDYTQQNVKSISKQLEAAREALDPFGVAYEVDLENGNGQSMMEIVEELDDDENVVSSKVSKPGESADEVLASLKKAGMSEKDWVEASDGHAEQAAKASNGPSVDGADQSGSRSASPIKSIIKDQSQTENDDTPKRKSVSFASDTKPASQAPSESNTPGSSAQPNLSSLVKGSFSKDDRVWQLDDDEKAMDFSSPHIPVDESPEDAALRRQMLQYNMNEVGAVVAQMDLEEIGSSDEDSYDNDDDDDADLTGDSEDEEEHGMSTRSTISKSYREEMRQLEKKLSASILQNVGQGPLPEGVDTSGLEEVGKTETLDVDEPGSSSSKKFVRFSEDHVLAPSKSSPKEKSSAKEKAPALTVEDKPAPPPMNDAVIERSKSEDAVQAPAPKPQKMSRFKSTRAEAAGASKLVQRKDAPLADTIVERPTSTSNNVPPDEDDLHPEQLRRELAQDYYRQRNKFIKRQGGFLEDDVDEIDEGDQAAGSEGENEAPKKVSRFMAARVKPDKIW